MDKMDRIALLAGVGLFCLAGVAQGQTVFLARKALGVVSHLAGQAEDQIQGQGKTQEQGKEPEVASVLLGADADHVYAKAVKVLQGNPKVQITRKDDAHRTVVWTYEQQSAALKVSRLQPDVSQLLVAAATASGKKTDASWVLDGVFRVCKEAGVSCTLAQE